MDKRPKLKWIKKWKVPSISDPKKITVSLALDGVTWGVPAGLGVKHGKIVDIPQ